MLEELGSFPVLTEQERFNLVNLPEVEVAAGSNAEGATLCDICLVVPGLRDWIDQSEVQRLC